MISDIFYTFGDSIIFEKVFSALSLVLYGDTKGGLHGTFHSLLRISLVVGGFSALLLAFFRQKFEPLIRSFLLPALIIVFFLLIPRTALTFPNHNTEEKSSSIEVPFFLGKFASIISSSFHHLHLLFKKALSDTHSWTECIYSGENFFSPTFTHSDVEENFREFCRECVFHDLGLGLYSKEDLFQAEDLMEFLQAKSSSQRGLQKDLSCQKAAIDLQDGLKSLEVKKHPLIENTNDLAKQKFAIDILLQELFQPKNVKKSYSSLAIVILMSLQKFLEALLYLIFPLIILLSLLSFGIQVALLWMRAILWISIWPIFYLAVDLFCDSLWKMKAETFGFTLENALRLKELYTTIEWIAFAALITLPFISWMIMSGRSQIFAKPTLLAAENEKKYGADPVTMTMPQDIPRQANWDILVGEAFQKPTSDDSFQTLVAYSKDEERANHEQNSLALIQSTLKDLAAVEKRSEQSEAPIQATLPPINNHLEIPIQPMHIPSFGSWNNPL